MLLLYFINNINTTKLCNSLIGIDKTQTNNILLLICSKPIPVTVINNKVNKTSVNPVNNNATNIPPNVCNIIIFLFLPSLIFVLNTIMYIANIDSTTQKLLMFEYLTTLLIIAYTIAGRNISFLCSFRFIFKLHKSNAFINFLFDT